MSNLILLTGKARQVFKLIALKAKLEPNKTLKELVNGEYKSTHPLLF